MNIHRMVTALMLSGSLLLASAQAAAPSTDTVIRNAISKILPHATIDEISPSPIKGISEVIMGTNLYYATDDGKYIFQGNLIDLGTRVNLSEERLRGIRLSLLKKVDQKDMIIFPAAKEKHVITVFTDIDCGYCRKLHKEIKQYTSRGISVHYLSFPRSGANTPSFYKAEAVWCSKDRKEALTRAKLGESIPVVKCDNPVRKEMELGDELGVTGTPAIFLEDGTLLPGYVPAPQLAAELDRRADAR
jgi:thiol:disulfide interchange protein DsbC